MREYDVMVNGVRTTLLLSDRAAAARGLTPNTAVTDTPSADDQAGTKAHTPENKARTAPNKASDKRAEAAARAFGGQKSDAGPDAG